MGDADGDVLLVSLADKLHNARTVLLDFRTKGLSVLGRFNLTGNQTLWYYEQLAETYRRCPGPLAAELTRVVADLRRELRNVTAATVDPEWVKRYGQESWEAAMAVIGEPIETSEIGVKGPTRFVAQFEDPTIGIPLSGFIQQP